MTNGVYQDLGGLMMIDCASCGEPLMDGTDECGSCGVERSPGAATGTDAIEHGAFFLGLFAVIQPARIYMAPDVDPWVQVARGVMGALGVGLLVAYHRDISGMSESARMAVKAALYLILLLSLAVWLG